MIDERWIECDDCGCPAHVEPCAGFDWDQHLGVIVPCDCDGVGHIDLGPKEGT